MKTNLDFTFKKYQILKISKNLCSKFLIIANSHINKHSDNKKNSIINLLFYKYKTTNKAFTQIVKATVYKNFENIINGPIFFLQKKKNKTMFNKKNLPLLNTLILKLNNKIYSPKKILISTFFTYKENIILFFQLKIVEIKKIY